MWELQRPKAEEHKSQNHFPIVVVLDNIRSMHNVGSVFRTADATNVSAIYLCGMTPQPPHRDIQKTALGATESVHWRYFERVEDALSELRKQGYILIGIEQVHGSKPLPEISFDSVTPIAFILGNEVEGVSDEALNMCDSCIEIPQLGAKHSFNISVAAGIILWEWVRQAVFGK